MFINFYQKAKLIPICLVGIEFFSSTKIFQLTLHRKITGVPRLIRILPSFGLLRDLKLFEIDVSELPICPIFKSQAVQNLTA